MRKELGQIHTVNFVNVIDSNDSSTFLQTLDVSGELSAQLSRNIRQAQSFKIVGIDIATSTVGTQGGGQVVGELRYMAPTLGRCKAYKMAYQAMMRAMKLQGITPSVNKNYDFRVGLSHNAKTLGPDGNTILNQATLDGEFPLFLTSTKENGIFRVYNQSVEPQSTNIGDLFPSGYNTMGVQSTPTDFVLGDSLIWSGNIDQASEQYESIPFTLSWTPDSTDIAVSVEWRPDPALYLAVLTGQFDLYVEEINVDGGADELELNVAIMVSGWKSIVSKPRRKKTSKKRRKSSRRKR